MSEGGAASELATLHQRIAALEARLPDSKVISERFLVRVLAILGHQLARSLVLWAIFLVPFLLLTFARLSEGG